MSAAKGAKLTPSQIARDWVRRHSGTKGNERLVLISLADWTGTDGTASVVAEMIASDCGINRATVFRVLERLIEKRKISRTGSRGRVTNTYRVTVPVGYDPKLDTWHHESGRWLIAQGGDSAANRRTGATVNSRTDATVENAVATDQPSHSDDPTVAIRGVNRRTDATLTLENSKTPTTRSLDDRFISCAKQAASCRRDLLKGKVNHPQSIYWATLKRVKNFGPEGDGEAFKTYLVGNPDMDDPEVAKAYASGDIPGTAEYDSSSQRTRHDGAVTRSRRQVAEGDVRAYRDTGQDDLADDLQAQIDAGEFDESWDKPVRRVAAVVAAGAPPMFPPGPEGEVMREEFYGASLNGVIKLDGSARTT